MGVREVSASLAASRHVENLSLMLEQYRDHESHFNGIAHILMDDMEKIGPMLRDAPDEVLRLIMDLALLKIMDLALTIEAEEQKPEAN